MPTYKTAPLVDYEQSFQDVAADLYGLVPARSGGKAEKGSYSFRLSPFSHETMAKIIIYEKHRGVAMLGELPLRHDGVYVLVRTNGTCADAVWTDISWRVRDFGQRLLRSEGIAIAPHHNETFAFFPVMAGENLSRIAEFISALVDKANTLVNAYLTNISGNELTGFDDTAEGEAPN
jgi:hypothetical protein